MDQATARRFFEQLETFSFRCRVALGLDGDESPWGLSAMPGAQPKGAVLHYTADGDTGRVVRWFTDPTMQAKASAHVVVAPRPEKWAEGLAKDLDLVARLPVTVVQCRRPQEVAWHATWANASMYGIENVNHGELRMVGGSPMWWRPRDHLSGDWTSPYLGTARPVALYGRWWEPYTAGQLSANVTVLRAVNALFGGAAFQRSWIVGHEHVQGTRTAGGGGHDKRDPGPHLPIHEIRQVVMSGDHPEVVDTALSYETWPQVWRARSVVAALTACGLPKEPDPWSAFVNAVARLAANDPAVQNPRVLCKTMMYVLGYNMVLPYVPTMEAEDTASVYLLQKLCGMAADGILGPATRSVLIERFHDRFGSVP